MKIIETICVRYPDDLEAKAWLALLGMGQNRYGTEQIIREILSKNPDHPGAHHYRIHNWNYHEPEQALDSCKRYGELAPGSGHALHMPGHVYATVGMWNEAAISMDAATRTEKKNMRDLMTFPYNHWNYGHNRAYLSYIQEQLGMPDEAIFGARQMIDAPRSKGELGQSVQHAFAGHDLNAPRAREVRALGRDPQTRHVPLARHLHGQDEQGVCRNARSPRPEATRQSGEGFEAHAALKKDIEKNKNWTEFYDIQSLELRGRIQLAKGNTLEGLTLLSQAAEKQFEQQKQDNDPPKYPELLYNALARAYLDAKSPNLAAKAFAKSLTLVRNDRFALEGAHATARTPRPERDYKRCPSTNSAPPSGSRSPRPRSWRSTRERT